VVEIRRAMLPIHDCRRSLNAASIEWWVALAPSIGDSRAFRCALDVERHYAAHNVLNNVAAGLA
jgi:hypothetical protein